METDRREPNVNVTLKPSEPKGNTIAGRNFPCPVCASGLDIRLSRTGKPYCVCIECGIQIFFRGKLGIKRLHKIMEEELLVPGKGFGSHEANLLFNRIRHLKKQRRELNEKQGLVFIDLDVKNAIQAVDNEIERVQGKLANLGLKIPRENIK
jgi:hypothetical protein